MFEHEMFEIYIILDFYVKKAAFNVNIVYMICFTVFLMLQIFFIDILRNDALLGKFSTEKRLKKLIDIFSMKENWLFSQNTKKNYVDKLKESSEYTGFVVP